MGMSTDQVPEYGHSRNTAEGIDGLNVRTWRCWCLSCLISVLGGPSCRPAETVILPRLLSHSNPLFSFSCYFLVVFFFFFASLLQLLEQHLAGKEAGSDAEDDEAAWDEWSSDSGSDLDSEDGWQNVESDSDNEIDISDSDDDEDDKTRRQLKKEAKEKRARQLAGLPRIEDSDSEEEEEEADDGKSEAAVSDAVGGSEIKTGELDLNAGSMSQLATQKVRMGASRCPHLRAGLSMDSQGLKA